MRYKLLGRSGLRVSELCLGTMTFGEDWGWGASKADSQKVFDIYAEAGGNFIDTSVNYTDGTSEKFIGEFIQRDRDHFVVATKYTLTSSTQTDPNRGGNSRKNMRRSVEQSLRSLQTDFIDLLYLHMWDHMTPVEEVVRGLDDLVRAGKVNYVAFSDTPAWIIAEANTRAELMGWSRFVALQVPYSLADRGVERAEIQVAKHWDMALLPWGILEAGLLTGKYTSDNADPKRMKIDTLSEPMQTVIRAVETVAKETGRSMSQVAINWVRGQTHSNVILPILGARSEKQIRDNLAVLEWELTPEQLQKLTESSPISYDFPRDFLEGGARNYIFGKTFDQIDNHRANYK